MCTLTDMTLRYCSISPLMMGHCCTPQMETKMATQSRVQLERFLSEQVLKICNILNTKASKFNGSYFGENRKNKHL